jgi:hypothetical protein
VSPALLRRQAVLAGVAVVAGLGAYGLAERDGGGETLAIQAVDGAEVQEAIVGVYVGRRPDAGCGEPVGPSVVGIVHPVLPCGVQLVLLHAGQSVRTEVVGRDRVGASRNFDLTAALAERLGIGPQGGTLSWRFAG